MIQGLVGALIKSPEESKFQYVEGKKIITFTIVENRRSSKADAPQVSFFYNINVIAQSDKQEEFYLSLPKGKVCAFSNIQVQSVKQADADSGKQTHNINLSAGIVNPFGFDDQEGGSSSRPSTPAPNNFNSGAGNRRANANATPPKQAVKSPKQLEDTDPFADSGDDEDPFDGN